MIAAPATLSLRVRALLVLALTAANSAIYLLSNAYPSRVPASLPRNAIDDAFGWHAWSIWPYWMLLLLAPFMALGLRERRILAATIQAYALALGLNLTIWVLWPTTLARQVHDAALDPFTATAWRLLLAVDGPNNCFPSGHVTIPVVVAAGFCRQYPLAHYWVWPLIVLLLPSVISTGQHYSLDILGGFATAMAGLLLARLRLADNVVLPRW